MVNQGAETFKRVTMAMERLLQWRSLLWWEIPRSSLRWIDCLHFSHVLTLFTCLDNVYQRNIPKEHTCMAEDRLVYEIEFLWFQNINRLIFIAV